MPGRHRQWALLAAAVAATLAGGCTDKGPGPVTAPAVSAGRQPRGAAGPTGQLQWFGYVAGVSDDGLNATDSYTNFGWVSADNSPTSTAVTNTINVLQQHNMKAVVELGQLLWCDPFGHEGPPQWQELCPEWRQRWATWRDANSAALHGGALLAMVVREEPFAGHVNIAQFDSASVVVKGDFPEAKLLLVEGADTVAEPSPWGWFNRYAATIRTVDWIAVDKYAIDPDTSTVLRTGLARLKAAYPGRKVAYAADGWWDQAHGIEFRTADLGVMGGIMQKWYDYAARDPDAVLIGVFLWDHFDQGPSSRDLPRPALLVHTATGRAITGRTRAQRYQPVGSVESVTSWGYATGWACDPDGAWAESVTLDFYTDGVWAGSAIADRPSEEALIGWAGPCRTGVFHRFAAQLSRTGIHTVVVIHDLDAGSVTIPAPPYVRVESVAPSTVAGGPANTFAVAGTARDGSGTVQLVWRDATAGGGLHFESYLATPAAGGTWTNTLHASNYCHDYSVYGNFSGTTSPTFTYHGLTSGYCREQARVIWIQPASLAGFGPAGTLTVAGSATGAPAGTGVVMWWRDVTAGGPWTQVLYAAPTDANGIWYNTVPNANNWHQYAVYAINDVVKSATCTYAGTGGKTNCP
jgi:hypothetical protein